MNGYARTTSATDARLNIVTPSRLTTKFDVWWTRQPSGGTFGVYVNGVLQNTINTAGGTDKSGWFRSSGFSMTDDGTGVVNISLRSNGDGDVEILGIAYNNNTDEHRLQNWSHSGRKAQYVSDSVITNAARGAKYLVWALGHNDQNSTGADLDAVLSKLDTVLSTCQTYNTKLIVCDFIWDKGYSNKVKAKLKEIGTSDGMTYIEFSKFFNIDSSLATSSELIASGFLVDSSHPSHDGHKTVAETIAKKIGLSISSKNQLEPLRLWRYGNVIDFTPSITNANIVASKAFYEIRDGYVDLVFKARVDTITGDVILTIPSEIAPDSTYYTTGGVEAQFFPITLVAVGLTGVTPSACQFTTVSTLRFRNTSTLNDNSDIHAVIRYMLAT